MGEYEWLVVIGLLLYIAFAGYGVQKKLRELEKKIDKK